MCELQAASLKLHRNPEVGPLFPHFTDEEIEPDMEGDSKFQALP